MSTLTNCLNNVIGLSQTPCDCWTSKPADYNTSDSGLFLDELLPMNNFTGLENCEDDDIWQIMADSRTEGIKRYIADIKALLLKNNEETVPYFSGKIGEAKGTVVQNFSSAMAGVAIRCNPIKNGFINITSVGGLFNKTGTKLIYLMDNLGNLITQFDIDTKANVYVNTLLTTPIELPLYSEDTEIINYFLFYADDTIQPLNNSILCNKCVGFSPCWRNDSNCYNREINNSRFNWAKYLQISGVELNQIEDLYTSDFVFNSSLYGLTVDCELWCSIDEMFCVERYESSAIASSQALAIRFKSAEYAINKILLSDKLTRSKLINRESLIENKKEWQLEYEKYLQFISENIDVNKTSCLKCRDVLKARLQLV